MIKLPETRPLRFLVSGEVVLDRYVSGEVERISPEAPIPVLRVRQRVHKPGNAGFVAAGLAALGGTPSMLSLVGSDSDGGLLRELLMALGARTDGLAVDPHRPTVVKERLLGSVQSANRATQQLLRVDQEEVWPLSAEMEDELLERLPGQLAGVDGVLVSDINKGLLTPRFLRALIDGAKDRNLPAIVDPRLSDDFLIYRGATALTPNRYETERATGIALRNAEAWRAAAQALIKRLDLEACLITLDREGMYLADRNGAGVHLPTNPRDVYDVTGAGDVVLTVFSFYTVAGLDFVSAAALANIAAGLEVTRLGAEVISRDDLERAIALNHSGYEKKIVNDGELRRLLEEQRQQGRRIGFTNGCFDLLHIGHLGLLSFARAQCDVLVVGVNSDGSTRQLKGPGRPVFTASERTRMLAALEMVDHVVVFPETNAERIIRDVRPDVLVKGWDYQGKIIDGQKLVQSYGGRVAIAPMFDRRSTTETLARLRGTDVDAGSGLATADTESKG
jgi:D-beta-D-heptose 7-phosphate kinase / D-beta-D-heptose 1-phosphate adenosyltransferase